MSRSILALAASAAAFLFSPEAYAQMQPQAAIPPAPPPTTADPANAGPFPVGLWTRNCKSGGTPLRLRKDHRYERASDAGSWRIVKTEIVFSWRNVPPMATGAMERSAPIVTQRVAIKRLAPDRMTLEGVAWVRCSIDPDRYQL